MMNFKISNRKTKSSSMKTYFKMVRLFFLLEILHLLFKNSFACLNKNCLSQLFTVIWIDLRLEISNVSKYKHIIIFIWTNILTGILYINETSQRWVNMDLTKAPKELSSWLIWIREKMFKFFLFKILPHSWLSTKSL